jgi:hypothetical protein
MKSAAIISAFFGGILSVTMVAAQQPTAAPPSAGAQPGAANQASQPAASEVLGARLELHPASFDFGEVWQGAPAKREFHIKNTGSDPLTLSITSSCGCTVATKPKSPLAPGESDTFTITYDTRRIGPAHKKVSINSNDPTQPTIIIDVTGTVKPIFAATPPECSFADAEENTVATKTIRLENQYTRPLPLRIKPGQNIQQFQCELKEIEPGKVYELTVTTRPPLNQGKNMTRLALEMGEPDLPDIDIKLSASVQPRATLSPMAIYVTPSRSKEWNTMLTVQYRADKPLTVVGAHSDLESIKCEVLPQSPPPKGAIMGYHQIRVTLPRFSEIPPTGAKIFIDTDDPDPKFATMVAPVTRREGHRRTRAIAPTHPQSAPGTYVGPDNTQPEPKK